MCALPSCSTSTIRPWRCSFRRGKSVAPFEWPYREIGYSTSTRLDTTRNPIEQPNRSTSHGDCESEATHPLASHPRTFLVRSAIFSALTSSTATSASAFRGRQGRLSGRLQDTTTRSLEYPQPDQLSLIPPLRSAGLQVGERCEDSAVVIAGL